MADRVEWTCPSCAKRFRIPAHIELPKACPECRPTPQQQGGPTLEPLPPAAAELQPMQFDADDSDEFDMEPAYAPPLNVPSRPINHDRKYPALRIVSLFYMVMGAIVAIGTLFVLLTGVYRPSVLPFLALDQSKFSFIVATLVGIIASITLFASGELIKLAIDMEENTRRR